MDPRPRPQPPSRAVASAFGVERPTPVPGGQGTTYGDDRVVLKPVSDVVQAEWLARMLDGLPDADDLRVIRPVRSTAGAWVVDGWAAWHRLEGATRPAACRETLEVSARFHQLVAAVPWPDAAGADDPWALGHRVAWDEETIDVPDVMRDVVERLQAQRAPLELASQLIHADLGNNVLFDDTLPPAVIDVSPAWRPARYADAIIVVDAVGWGGASPDVVEPLADAEGRQLLVRAALFRLASAIVLCEDDAERLDAERDAYGHVADVIACVRSST